MLTENGQHLNGKHIDAVRRIYASETGPSLLQIMACHHLGAKLSSEPMLTDCKAGP